MQFSTREHLDTCVLWCNFHHFVTRTKTWQIIYPVFRTFGSSLYSSIFSACVQIVYVICCSVDCSTVHGSEYSFGAHDHPSSGVFEVEPKSCPGFIYRCTVFIGHTTLNPLEFREFIQRMASEYHGDTYHLISKNCNHFTDDLSTRLTGKSIPGWVNRLARLGNKTGAPLYIVFESFWWNNCGFGLWPELNC